MGPDLIVMVIALFIFLITFVVPRFAQLYEQLGTHLPPPLQVYFNAIPGAKGVCAARFPVPPCVFLLKASFRPRASARIPSRFAPNWECAGRHGSSS